MVRAVARLGMYVRLVFAVRLGVIAAARRIIVGLDVRLLLEHAR
jgi:hypothetical protein